MKINAAQARVVLNAKAAPTIEVELNVAGHWARASVPAGTSAGKHEVKPWPKADNIDLAVSKAKRILEEEIFPEILQGDWEPREIDEFLEQKDGTDNFHNIGGNTALAVSIAAMKAFAWDAGIQWYEAVADMYGFRPAPVKPLENFIGGGAHGGHTDIQEFLVSVKGTNMAEMVHTLSWAYRQTKELLKKADPHFVGALTLESAFVTELGTRDILNILSAVRTGLEELGYEVVLGIDVAAAELWNGSKYVWKSEGVKRTTEEQMQYLRELAVEYKLNYIEDPFHDDDFESFKRLQASIDSVVTGDDLFVTNAERLRKGIGGVLIKYNQRGTLLRTVRTVKKARELGMTVTVSHRSGETDDPFLSHFAVGVGADFAKIGAAGLRTVKLNELIRISEELER